MKVGIIGAGNTGEVIVLSIPFAKYPDLATLFDDVPNDVAVIDTSNSYPLCDGAISEADSGNPESVWISEQIGSSVISGLYRASFLTPWSPKLRSRSCSARPGEGSTLARGRRQMDLMRGQTRAILRGHPILQCCTRKSAATSGKDQAVRLST
jgi:hypothetical protein